MVVIGPQVSVMAGKLVENCGLITVKTLIGTRRPTALLVQVAVGGQGDNNAAVSPGVSARGR